MKDIYSTSVWQVSLQGIREMQNLLTLTSKGKYSAPCMPLSTSAITELHWWLKHLKNASQSLQDISVDCTIQTDASEHE